MLYTDLSISERFVELGNRFFNVHNHEWEEGSDLSYEGSDSDPLSSFIVAVEKKSKNILSPLILVLKTFIKWFKISKSSSSNDVNKSKMEYNIEYGNIKNANQIINNYVRKKLLETINEGVEKYINDNNKKSSEIRKPVSKVKNQLKCDVKDSVDNGLSKNRSIKNGIPSLFITTIFHSLKTFLSFAQQRLFFRTKHRIPRRKHSGSLFQYFQYFFANIFFMNN